VKEAIWKNWTYIRRIY